MQARRTSAFRCEGAGSLAAHEVERDENEQAGEEPSAWVEEAWRLALARPPSTQEKHEALALMDKLARQGPMKDADPLPAPLTKLEPARAAALARLCLTIFNLSEFTYID